jgi:hypothetical protein
MTEKLHPIIIFELSHIVIYTAGWWMLYYKLHRPSALWRRAALIVSFIAVSVILRLVHLSNTGYGLLWAGAQLFFALIAGDWRSSFFTALIYIGVEQTIDVTRHCFIGYMFGGFFQEYSLAKYMQYNLQYIVMLAWTILYYIMMRNRNRKLPLRFWIMTVLPPIFTFLTLTHFSETAYPLLLEGTNIYLDGLLFGGFFLILNHSSLFMYINLIHLFDSRLESQTLQARLDAQTRLNQFIEGAQKQIAETRHDMKNLIFAIQIELDRQNYDGIRTRLNALLDELKQYELKPYTGVPVIDAMISFKGDRLRELGGSLAVTAEPLNIGDAFAYDITTILAIALDNAMDAGSFEEEEKTVHCTLQQRKNLLFIRVINPSAKPVKYNDSAERGFGFPDLRRITERYSGEVKITDQNGVFSLEIMLLEN